MCARPIDSAMSSKRRPKESVRELWLNEIEATNKQYSDTKYPLYLTLPGAEGYDIEMLIDSGIIRITETKSINEKDIKKIVAVESNNKAVLNLQKKFPGLRIEEQNLQNILRGDGLEAWPKGDEKDIFCAHIVNLDFDGSIKCDEKNGTIIFKELEWIYKICLLRSNIGIKKWKLFLTFNAGTKNWKVEVLNYIKNFLHENIKEEEKFSNECKNLFGEEMFSTFNSENKVTRNKFTFIELQKIYMIFVPKFLSNKLHVNGWKLKTKINLYYGGNSGTAPMVTWIIDFHYDAKKLPTPKKIYRESLMSIFRGVGYIDEQGKLKN